MMPVVVTLGDIQKKIGGKLVGEASYPISNIGSLEFADERSIAFLAHKKMIPQLEGCCAGALLIEEELELLVPNVQNAIFIKGVQAKFREAADIICPVEKDVKEFLSPKASVDSSAKIGARCKIGDNVIISKDSAVGDNCTIMPGVYIGRNVRIGEGTIIYPNCVIYGGTEIGRNVIINANTVIGKDGFGFYEDKEGKINRVRHFGSVLIEDKVEIGSCCVIDRGTYGKTIVKAGTKTDNLVQISHNVQVGENNMLMGQVGIAGSTKTGSNCILLGQSGVVNGVSLHDRTILAAGTKMRSGTDESGVWIGFFARPLKKMMRIEASLSGVEAMKKETKELAKELQQLKQELAELKEGRDSK